MCKYTAETVHTEKTITQFAKMQYLTFSMGIRSAVMLICIVFLMLALFGDFSQGITILFLILGCLPLAAINQPAKQTAESTLKQINGNFPTIAYIFDSKGMHVRNGEKNETIKYCDIVRLVMDDDYAYLFLHNHSGYMIAMNTLTPNSIESFHNNLAEWVGVKWTRNKKLLNISIQNLMENFRNTKK